MKKLVVAIGILVLMVLNVSAQPIDVAKINDTNYMDVKTEIVQLLDKKINELEEFKKEIVKANSSEELREVLNKQKLEIAKNRSIRFVDLAIKKLEIAKNSIETTIPELKSLKERIKDVNNMDELKNTMKEVKETLTNLTKEMRHLKHGRRPMGW